MILSEIKALRDLSEANVYSFEEYILKISKNITFLFTSDRTDSQ